MFLEKFQKKLDPFDYNAFFSSPTNFFAGTTDVETGKPVFWGKENIDENLAVIKASCALPVMATMVPIQGRPYLDGGVSAPIPFQKALDDGCEHLIIVLTQPRGYQKQPQSMRGIYRAWYRKYPALVQAINNRHLVYNNSLVKIAQLEKEGLATIIAPDAPLTADRFGKDKDALIDSYNIGFSTGQKATASFSF